METKRRNPDPMRSIEITVIDFFDYLGKFIIKSKQTGEYIGYDKIIPSYVDRMKEIAMKTDMVSGDFNCGTSADIANTLWNSNVSTYPGVSMSYRHYILKICEEFYKCAK